MPEQISGESSWDICEGLEHRRIRLRRKNSKLHNHHIFSVGAVQSHDRVRFENNFAPIVEALELWPRVAISRCPSSFSPLHVNWGQSEKKRNEIHFFSMWSSRSIFKRGCKMRLEKAEKRAKARLIVYEFFVSASHFFCGLTLTLQRVWDQIMGKFEVFWIYHDISPLTSHR